MKQLKNLINKEEDFLSDIDETPILIEEKELEHEHLHINENIKKDF